MVGQGVSLPDHYFHGNNMNNKRINSTIIMVVTLMSSAALGFNGQQSDIYAGPYSSAMDNRNPKAADAAIAGFIGSVGRGVCPPGINDDNPSGNDPDGNYLNPVFCQWASGLASYIPAPAADNRFIGNEKYTPTGGVPAIWRKPLEALGAVTGDNFHVCVLGDLSAWQIAILDPANSNYAVNAALEPNNPYKIQPGQITLSFSTPIKNGPGPDFAVFENGFISAGGAGVAGCIFAELAFVEVSTDGAIFTRFPSVSLTEPVSANGGTGPYGTIDPSNVYNLAGKHVNAYESSWGTPFNLSDLSSRPEVISGAVDLNNINFVKVIDIPGNGFFKDMATDLTDPNTIDPATGTGGLPYSQVHGVHDAWVTWGSGGHDLEAVGVIQQIYGDANSDGSVDLIDFIRLANNWQSYGNWPQGDFDEDRFVGLNDLALMAEYWLYDCRED